jgi:hypothetical protein
MAAARRKGRPGGNAEVAVQLLRKVFAGGDADHLAVFAGLHGFHPKPGHISCPQKHKTETRHDLLLKSLKGENVKYLVILKKYPGKIGTRTETKVDNGKDYNAEAYFVDHFMIEIFIPIGGFDEILKAADQGSFG